jgi:hypothetical protein
MATLFCDRKGVLMVEFMQQGTTVTSEVYCKMLGKLHGAVHSKRHRMLTSSVLLVLLNDSVHMHTTARTQALLNHFSWELFVHLPYSHELALSDYHLLAKTYSPVLQVPQFQQ